MKMTLGDPSGAVGCAYGSQSGVESRLLRLMILLNRFAIVFSSFFLKCAPLLTTSFNGSQRTLPNQDGVMSAIALDGSELTEQNWNSLHATSNP
jgi:hypothetical protein